MKHPGRQRDKDRPGTGGGFLLLKNIIANTSGLLEAGWHVEKSFIVPLR